MTAAQPPAAVQPPMEQRPAQRAELPSAPASPQTDKKEDTPDPQKLMLYQNRLALGGVVGNVLGKVRDAMTPQQNKPKTQQSSQEQPKPTPHRDSLCKHHRRIWSNASLPSNPAGWTQDATKRSCTLPINLPAPPSMH